MLHNYNANKKETQAFLNMYTLSLMQGERAQFYLFCIQNYKIWLIQGLIKYEHYIYPFN